RRRHTRFSRDWSSDVCSSDLVANAVAAESRAIERGRLEDFVGHPEQAVRGFQQRLQAPAGLGGAVGGELPAVEADEPVVGGEPEIARLAEMDPAYGVDGQAVVDGPAVD